MTVDRRGKIGNSNHTVEVGQVAGRVSPQLLFMCDSVTVWQCDTDTQFVFDSSDGQISGWPTTSPCCFLFWYLKETRRKPALSPWDLARRSTSIRTVISFQPELLTSTFSPRVEKGSRTSTSTSTGTRDVTRCPLLPPNTIWRLIWSLRKRKTFPAWDTCFVAVTIVLLNMLTML